MANKKQPEVRLSQNTLIAIIAIVFVAAVLFFPREGLTGFTVAPTDGTGAGEQPVEPAEPTTTMPLIEKTKVYLSNYDLADFQDDNQKNLVAGTAQIIKSGNLLETVTTSASTGTSSTAEFNGGDVISVLSNASGYYRNSVKNVVIDETLKPIEVPIAAAATPTVSVEDKNGNTVTAIAMSTNDLTEIHHLIVKRPGDDSWFQLCGLGADYDDEQVEYQFKDLSGSFNNGELDLTDLVDRLDTAGLEAWWDYDSPVRYYDELDIEFFIKADKDVDPGSSGAFNTTIYVVDCEENLQNGQIVYTPETAADGDVGLADITYNVEIQ